MREMKRCRTVVVPNPGAPRVCSLCTRKKRLTVRATRFSREGPGLSVDWAFCHACVARMACALGVDRSDWPEKLRHAIYDLPGAAP